MTTLHKAAQQVLDYWEAVRWSMDTDIPWSAFDALRAALAQQQADPGAYGYASRLAFAIWKKHYKDIAPQWKPLDDLMGVLTQIDNMTSGLTLLAQQAEPKGGGNLPPPLQAEPVAWYSVDQPLNYMTRCADGTEFINTVVMPAHAVSWAYTAPPQRKPLSLTDLQEALVLTNLIGDEAIYDPEEYDEGLTLAQIDELYRIIIKERV